MDAPRVAAVDEDVLDNLGRLLTDDESLICGDGEPFVEHCPTGRINADGRPLDIPVTIKVPEDTDVVAKYMREAMQKGQERANEALWHACVQKPAWLAAMARRDHSGNVTQKGGYQKAPPALRVYLNVRLQELIGVEAMNQHFLQRDPKLLRSALQASTSTSPSPESEDSASEKPAVSAPETDAPSISSASPLSNSNAPDEPSTPPTESPSPSVEAKTSNDHTTPTSG